jgi:hypothetical protein
MIFATRLADVLISEQKSRDVALPESLVVIPLAQEVGRVRQVLDLGADASSVDASSALEANRALDRRSSAMESADSTMDSTIGSAMDSAIGSAIGTAVEFQDQVLR